MKTTVFATLILALSGLVYGQGATITGTAIIYGSGMNTRTTTSAFTLRVNSTTNPADAASYLSTLADRGQDAMQDALRKNDLGRFSLGGRLGEPLEAVVMDQVEGRTRIRAIFQRWMGFGELRGGYRSTDYPFGYVEVLVDPRTGKGEGTFIPAARIRFRGGKNGAAGTVEIEDFGTFPSRLMGVQLRGTVPR
jgi:hypothetical protein